jgi:hypothetical protein
MCARPRVAYRFLKQQIFISSYNISCQWQVAQGAQFVSRYIPCESENVKIVAHYTSVAERLRVHFINNTQDNFKAAS